MLRTVFNVDISQILIVICIARYFRLGNCIKKLFSNLLIFVLKLISLLIRFVSTEHTEMFFIEELKSVSIILDSVLIRYSFITVEDI